MTSTKVGIILSTSCAEINIIYICSVVVRAKVPFQSWCLICRRYSSRLLLLSRGCEFLFMLLLHTISLQLFVLLVSHDEGSILFKVNVGLNIHTGRV